MIEWVLIGGAYYLINSLDKKSTPNSDGYITNKPYSPNATPNTPAPAPVKVLDSPTPIALPIDPATLNVSGAKKLASQYIAELHPQAQPIFLQFIQRLNHEGWKVIITSAYRSFQEQIALKNKMGAGAATPGLSYHNYGMAIDINCIKDFKQLKKSSTADEWRKSGVVDIAKSLGLRWGGVFGGNYDPVHFDLPLMPTTELLALAKQQYGSPADAIGNQVVLSGVGYICGMNLKVNTLLEVLQSAKQTPNIKSYYDFKVSNLTFYSEIEKHTSISVIDYFASIDSDGILHAKRKHPDLTEDDFLMIPQILESFDYTYKGKDEPGLKRVLFEKTIGPKNYILETVFELRTKRKKISLVTLYKKSHLI